MSLCAAASHAGFKANKTSDSVVDSQALTVNGKWGHKINGASFQQEAAASHNNWQYVGYYDGKRRVCLARRQLPAGDWEVVRFADYHFKSNDGHNTISIGICPGDGTIHLSWDHHADPLKYRVSKKHVATKPAEVEWTSDLFGPIRAELEEGQPFRLTYPRFVQTPDGGLQFFYRLGGSGRGDRMMVDYDPKQGKWHSTRQIDSASKGIFEDEKGRSETRCSYPNGYTYGPKGRLHATWVWRESIQGANHDLIYVYSDDRGKTWRNNTGNVIEGPTAIDSPGVTVVEIPRSLGLMNTHGQAVDSQGRIHCAVWHCTEESIKAAGSELWAHRWGPPAARRYHHYWRANDGTWMHRELPQVAGNRPKLFLDAADNAFLIYRSGTQEARGNQFVLAGTRSGDLVIAAATAKSKWTDWRVIHTEPGPFGNEMLGDPYRWTTDGVLSIMVQEAPDKNGDSTPLRILDFTFNPD